MSERRERAQFIATDNGIDSVHDILIHIASAQSTWLKRWQGIGRPMPWNASACSDVAALRDRWNEVERATSPPFVARLRPADRSWIVRYVYDHGET